MYLGNIRLGDTIHLKFTTVNTSGVPTTLAGTPVVSAYPGNSTTQLTAGITLTVDFDAVTGLHDVTVVASSGNGYATATNYALVITTGTVGGSSVVGYVVGAFSIENRAALIPTTAARTLDVSAAGEAGIDWANIGSPTTTVALTGTTVDLVANAVDSTAIATGAITAAKFAAGAIDATAIANGAIDAATFAASAIDAAAIADGAIDAATFAAGAINAAALASDAVTEIRSVASGTADSGTTLTMVDAVRTEADTDYWKGMWIVFTSGTLLGQTRLITGFTPATDTITFAPATTLAVGTHTYEILPSGSVNVQQWLSATVNALISGRVDSNMQALAADVITAASIANGAIDAATFAAGAIDNAAFNVTETLTANPATGGIAAASFAAGAIDAASIATGAITAAKFAAGAIDNAAFNVTETLTANPASGGIVAASFGAGAIDNAAFNVTETLTANPAAGGIAAASFAAGAIDAAALAADAGTEIANAVKAAVIESQGSYTIQQALSIILSALAGVTSTSGATLKTPDGVATRIAATINASQERTAMTLTPSA